MNETQKTYYSWLSLFALGVIWGGSFILMKYGLRSFNFWQVSSIRMFSAFLFLIPLIIKYFKKLTRKNALNLMFVGLIGNLIPSILFPLGQQKVDSNIAGILNSLAPVFVVIIGFFFFKLKTNFRQISGLLLGLIGAIMIITKDDLFNFGSMNAYALFIVLAAICYALNMNQVNKYLKNMRGVEITALAFLFIGPVSGSILLFSDFSQAYCSQTVWIDLAGTILLGILASAFAVIMINFLIIAQGPVFASSVTYIIPVFAIIWGLIDGEIIILNQIIATFVVLIGVYLVNKKPRNKTLNNGII